MKTNKKILFSVISIIVCLIVSVSFVFAWFTGAADKKDNIAVYTGDIDLRVNFYQGLDSDKNGIVDPLVDSNGVQLALNRAESLAGQYIQLDKDILTEHSGYIADESIVFKAAIINPSEKILSANISVWFSELQEYYYRCLNDFLATYLDENPSNDGTLPSTVTENNSQMVLDDFLSLYTARIIFAIEGIKVNVFSADRNAENDFLSGYSTLIRSSDAEEAVGSVELISPINSLGNEERMPLWEISENNKFAEQITINPGELMEISFNLTVLQQSEILSGYLAYSTANYRDKVMALIGDDAQAEQKAAAYVDAMTNRELQFFLSDDEGGTSSGVRELKFTIRKIYIEGKSIN